MRPRLLPKLWRDHPGFFLVYFATAFLHLVGGIQMLSHDGSFDGAVFGTMKDFMSIEGWGASSLAVWTVMTLGVYTNFLVGRIGLLGGGMLMLSQGLFLWADPNPSGRSLLIFTFIATIHFVQAAVEPPINPASRR